MAALQIAVLLGGAIALATCFIMPVVSVFAIRRLACDSACWVELYSLFVEAGGWSVAAGIYYSGTKKFRRRKHRWITLLGLYVISGLVFVAQFFFVVGIVSDDASAEVYVKTGSAGFTLLTLLLLLLTFVVKKNRKVVPKTRIVLTVKK